MNNKKNYYSFLSKLDSIKVLSHRIRILVSYSERLFNKERSSSLLLVTIMIPL